METLVQTYTASLDEFVMVYTFCVSQNAFEQPQGEKKMDSY